MGVYDSSRCIAFIFLGDGVVLRHLCFIFRSVLASPHPPHILRSAAYVRGYGDSVFQTHGSMGLTILASPRTSSAPLRMYGVREIASSRRMGVWVSLSLHPRTSSAPLRMYGVTEIASSRRMGLLDSISKFFIPHSSFIIFNFNLLCPVKNQYICKNKLNVKR